MAKTEVSTGQWIEFLNTFTARSDIPPHLYQPTFWGAERDPTYSGPGVRFRLKNVADAAQIGVYGMPWRTCAMYCNWLHNGKSPDFSAVMSGSYDVSTFGDNPDGTFSDQATHSSGARYWIPSFDEWLKAAHWSPTNPANGGWFSYSNASDIPFTYGPPPSFGGDGSGRANAGFQLPNFRHYDIPLRSYADTSIWGLFDIAGCGAEWTENIRIVNGQMYRSFDGSYAGSGGGLDRVYGVSDQRPGSLAGDFNLRLASEVSSPGGFGMMISALCVLQGRGRNRRRTRHDGVPDSRDSVRGGRHLLVLAERTPRRSSSKRAPSVASRTAGPTSRPTQRRSRAKR